MKKIIVALSVSALAFIAPAHADCSAAAAASESGGYFVADSFSFGVEREMKESGEKGGTQPASAYAVERNKKKESGEKGETQDINIGVGELQECTISKS